MPPRPLSLLLSLLLCCQTVEQPSPPSAAVPLRFTVRYPAELQRGPLDGRLVVGVATSGTPEPRLQVDVEGNTDATPEVSAIDVEGWKPFADAVIDEDVLGCPIPSLRTLPRRLRGAKLSCTATFHPAAPYRSTCSPTMPTRRTGTSFCSRGCGGYLAFPAPMDPKMVLVSTLLYITAVIGKDQLGRLEMLWIDGGPV